jgi:hypothetical protein
MNLFLSQGLHQQIPRLMSPRTKKRQEINRLKKLEDAGKQEKNPLDSSSSLKKRNLRAGEERSRQEEKIKIQASRNNL